MHSAPFHHEINGVVYVRWFCGYIHLAPHDIASAQVYANMHAVGCVLVLDRRSQSLLARLLVLELKFVAYFLSHVVEVAPALVIAIKRIGNVWLKRL